MHLNKPPADDTAGPAQAASREAASSEAAARERAANPFAPPRAALRTDAPGAAPGFGAWRLAALAASMLVLLPSLWLLAVLAEPFLGVERSGGLFALHQVLLFGLIPLSMLYNVASLALWRRMPALWKLAQVLGALLAVFGLVLLLLLLVMAWSAGPVRIGLALLAGALVTAPHLFACLAALAEEKVAAAGKQQGLEPEAR